MRSVLQTNCELTALLFKTEGHAISMPHVDQASGVLKYATEEMGSNPLYSALGNVFFTCTYFWKKYSLE